MKELEEMWGSDEDWDDVLSEFEQNAVIDRLTGWELIEFLDIPITDVLFVALDEGWINEENYKDLLEHVGFKDE